MIGKTVAAHAADTGEGARALVEMDRRLDIIVRYGAQRLLKILVARDSELFGVCSVWSGVEVVDCHGHHCVRWQYHDLIGVVDRDPLSGVGRSGRHLSVSRAVVAAVDSCAIARASSCEAFHPLYLVEVGLLQALQLGAVALERSIVTRRSTDWSHARLIRAKQLSDHLATSCRARRGSCCSTRSVQWDRQPSARGQVKGPAAWMKDLCHIDIADRWRLV